jgi:predicted Ser/Thr protein kinase
MTRHLYAGRYQSGDLVGNGVLSQVYRGRDQRLDRDVAIKVLRADLARDPSFQSRFRGEAQNAASLNHPAIVAVYDTGESAGAGCAVPFIVMEYVDGQTLRAQLEAEPTVAPGRALEIAADMCAALDFSHRSGIVHRNVTPANVMISRDGAVKVMDFAVARAADGGRTTATTVIGTAHYLSPEQAAGQTGDARSDIYSVGCVLYEMLCGKPPFTGRSPVAVAYQHVSEAPRPPSRSVPGLTGQIDAIVLKALNKNPLNRYQTAKEMRADLLRALAGQQVAATPLLQSVDPVVPAPGMPASRPTARRADLAMAAAGQHAEAGTRTMSGWPDERPGARAVPQRYDGDGRPVELHAAARSGPSLLAPVRPVPAIPSERDPEAEEKTRHVWRMVTLAVVGVCVIVALWLTLMVVLAPPPPAKVAVPDLTGMTLDQATATLQDKNLTLGTVLQVEVDDAEAGTIANQRPSRLTQVDEGSPVNVEVDSN